jgi:tape measure domain-containing protein
MGANDINIRIGAKLDGLQRDIKKSQGIFTRFANFAESTGRDLSTRLSLPILGAGAAAVTSFAKFEKLELSLKALAEEGEDTAATFKRLQEIAQLPGISLEQAAKGAAQLRAVGFEGAQAEEILKGLSKAVTLSGEGPEQLGSVVRQLVQMSSKGRILQEDLSVIQENVPSIGIAIQDAFGTNNIEAIRATGVSAQQFTAEIIKAISVNEKFQKVQGGISNEFDNFRQSVTASLAELGKTIAESINLSGILQKLSGFLQRVTQSFSELSPGVKRFIVITAGVVAAIGPLLFGFGAVVKAGVAIVAAIKLVSGALAALAANPVALAVIAIAGLALAIKTAYERSETFRKIVAQIGANLKATFAPVINGVIKLFQSLGSAVGTTGVDFNKFLAVVSGVFTAALEFINIFFEGVRAGAQGLGLLLDGEFAKAGDKLGEAIRKINPIDVAITQGKRLGGAYRDAYEESLNLSTVSAPTITSGGAAPDLNAVFANLPTTSPVAAAAKETAKAVEEIEITFERAKRVTSGLTSGLTRDLQSLTGIVQINATNLQGYTSFIGSYLAQVDLAAEKNSVFGDSFGLLNDKINLTKSALSEAVEQFGANSAEVGFLKEQLLGLNEEFAKTTENQTKLAETAQIFADGITSIGGSIAQMVADGTASLKAFAKAALLAIADIIGALIKQGVAAAITGSIQTAPGPVGLALAAAAGGIASGLLRGAIAKIKVPKLAAGGIIPPGFEGDRFPAMLNSGEAVIPLDKLFRVLGNGGGPTEFVVRGADLVAVMGRAQYNNNRTGI